MPKELVSLPSSNVDVLTFTQLPRHTAELHCGMSMTSFSHHVLLSQSSDDGHRSPIGMPMLVGCHRKRHINYVQQLESAFATTSALFLTDQLAD